MPLNILDPIQQGLAIRNQRMQQQGYEDERAKQAQIQDLIAQTQAQGLGSDAYKKLISTDLSTANKLKGMLDTDDDGMEALFKDAAMFKHYAQADPTGDTAKRFLQNRVETLNGLGRNSFDTQELLNIANQDMGAAMGVADKFLSMGGKDEKSKRVQNSRDVEGGTIITYSDGSQEFKKFGADVGAAADEFRQEQLPKLSTSMQNKQLEFQESANNAYSLSERTNTLADRLQSIDATAGAAGTAREMFLNVIGGQDEISNLRKDYTRIRNKLITANLPQGPATDKDIELIAAGFPDPSASKEQLTDFLRAMSRGQEAVAKFDEFKSVFLQENGNITRAVRDFSYDGQNIKKGERLASAYKRFSKSMTPKAEKKEAQQVVAPKASGSVAEQSIMAKYGL